MKRANALIAGLLVVGVLALPAAADPTGIVGDEFNTPGTPASRWALESGHSDSGHTAVVNASGQLVLTAPAGLGSSHNHNGGLVGGINHSVRLVQAAPNTDFEIIAKFDSGLLLEDAMAPYGVVSQGFIVEATPTDYMRFEMYLDTGAAQVLGRADLLAEHQLRVGNLDTIQSFLPPPPNYADINPYGARISVWLKLTRTGNAWTFSASLDGAAYSTLASGSATLAVTKVGIVSVNNTPDSGTTNAPQHVAIVDYFRAANVVPVAVNDAATSPQAGVAINVLSNDIDPDSTNLTPVGVTTPLHGTAVVQADKTILYTPTAGYAGADSFTYQVSDGLATSAAATVSVTVTGPPPPPPPPAPVGDTLGLMDPATGRWHLRKSLDSTVTTVRTFFYGDPSDIPVMGDWNGDGTSTPGMYRQSTGLVYLTNNLPAEGASGVGEMTFILGNPGDLPLAGDFDGDGKDTISVYRPSQSKVYVSNAIPANGTAIVASNDYFFGDPGDLPFVGDFNGIGPDTIGLYRQTTGFVYYADTHGPNGGVAPTTNSYFFGNPGDRFVGGDWDGDGDDTSGVFRSSANTFYYKNTNVTAVADGSLAFGQASWIPVAGRFGF